MTSGGRYISGYVMENGRIVMSGSAESLRKDRAVGKAYLGV